MIDKSDKNIADAPLNFPILIPTFGLGWHDKKWVGVDSFIWAGVKIVLTQCLLLLLLTAFILNHSGPLHVIFKSGVQRRHFRKFSRLIKLDGDCWTNICFYNDGLWMV